MEGHIHSTESFGTVDGPGIRFVIFFQGCPMRCLYCHNPDTWTIDNQNQENLRTVESLLKEYDGIKEFLHDGGITATGGEPLVQMEFLTELFEAAKKKGINNCLDTSGILFRQERRPEFDRLMADKAYLEQCYKEGAEKASRIAGRTMEKVKRKVGLIG